MTSYTDYTSSGTQFTYDLSNNYFFKKDPNNLVKTPYSGHWIKDPT